MYYGVHVTFKDDAIGGMVDFLTMMRSDHRFKWMPYEFGVILKSDRDAQWFNCKEWTNKVGKAFNIQLYPSDPSDKNSNSLAELANKEMERRTKSLLYSKNLPPSE